MPILSIDGRSVKVDDAFLSLSHEQQNATVEEIAKSFSPKPLQEPEAADHGLSERQKLSPVEKAINPITSYPATYDRMNKDAREQVSHGIDQLSHPDSLTDPKAHGISDVLTGAGNVALGGLAYVASPISAAYRSIAGQPVEDVTGIPREYTEFAAQLATPGIGITGRGPAAVGIKPSNAAPSIQELEAAYRSVRNSPEVKGAVVPIQDVQNLATSAEQELLARGNRPTPGSAPRTFNELDRLTPRQPSEPTPQQRLQAEMNWEKIPEQSKVTQATVDDLLAAKRGFGNVAGERKPFPAMGPTEDAGAATNVVKKLDDLIEESAPGMKDANANYSAAKSAEAIDRRIQKAEMRAAVNNSGMNIGNKIRQQAASVLESGAAKRGLRQEEISALEDIAYGTPTRNALRTASNLLGGGGGMGATVTGEVASHSLGAVGWLAAPLGHAMKHLENHLTVSAANKVSEAIRARSPLGVAMESSAQKWNEARGAFLKGPSSAKAAAFSIASRNLANTISGATGSKIDPRELLRSIQGPRPAGAEGEQQ